VLQLYIPHNYTYEMTFVVFFFLQMFFKPFLRNKDMKGNSMHYYILTECERALFKEKKYSIEQVMSENNSVLKSGNL
jgi:hypothetical protein